MTSSNPTSLFEKLWSQHEVAVLGDGLSLLFIDRCFLHDLSGPIALQSLARRELEILNPGLTFATPDHLVTSEPGRRGANDEQRQVFIDRLGLECRKRRVTLFDTQDDRQGIVHVVGPEQGITLPGTTVVCGDSHTCTHGGLGALAWGVGTSELTHVLATQCLIEEKPKTLLIRFTGELPPGVFAKDMILRLIARKGSQFGEGYAIEFGGEAVSALSIEGRLTLCNLTIELGAKFGIVAPDEKTVRYLAERPMAPKGELFDRAAQYWSGLRSDAGCRFDLSIDMDVSSLTPQISWGINPEHTIGICETIPALSEADCEATRDSWRKALEYMDLVPGEPIIGTPIDQVFIGSCANGRIEDLDAAARCVRNRRVAETVDAWVVPGSRQVDLQARRLGLRDVFLAAGFQWREPGCSLCPAANGDRVLPGRRCVTTSNRNFIGRQGPGARTHLASPMTAAAAAVTGRITDPRQIL